MKCFKPVLALLLVTFTGGMLWTCFAQAGSMQESTPLVDVEKEARRLKSSDPVERAMAACALRKAGRNSVVAISSLIAMLGDDTSIDPIQCLEDDRDYSEKSSPGREAAKTLAAMGEPALEHLLGALRDDDWRARKNVAWALGEMRYGDSSTRMRSTQALGAAVEDKHSEVQTSAIDSLGEIRDNGALKPLVAALKRPDAKVRGRAAAALGEIRDSAAVEALIGALDDESLPARLEVIRALAEIRDMRAVKPMISALSDTREEVRASLGDALKEITEQDFGADATKWREWLARDK